MPIKFVTSPEEILIADTPFELSDGLEIDSGVLEVKGTDGGFIDDFNGAVIDATKWVDTPYAILDGNGNLTFSGGADGFANKYVLSKVFPNGSGGTLPTGMSLSIDFVFNAISATRAAKVCLANSVTTYGAQIILDCKTDGRAIINFTGNAGTLNKTLTGLVDGDVIRLIFDVCEADTSGTSYSSATISYQINDGEIIRTGVAGLAWDKLFITSYYASNPILINKVEVLGYPTEETATLPKTEAYTAELPATLASLDGVLVNRASIGGGGEARLYYQYKDDEYDDWKSFDGVIGEWSDVGLIDGNFQPITNCKPLKNGFIRPKIVFTGSGLVSYPTIDKINYYWSSDITAPSSPTITTAIATNESILTILFANLLSDMYAIIYEVNINYAGSLPYSTRGKIESGYDYMRFRGNQTEVQKEAEINSLLSSINGLQEGDTVVITAFARDRVGNISAGTSTLITMTGNQYITMLTKVIKEKVLPTIVYDSVKGC